MVTAVFMYSSDLPRQMLIRVSVGYCYAKRPVQEVLGLGEDGIIRVSLVHYNTIEEVQALVELLDRVVCHASMDVTGEHITSKNDGVAAVSDERPNGIPISGSAKMLHPGDDVLRVSKELLTNGAQANGGFID